MADKVKVLLGRTCIDGQLPSKDLLTILEHLHGEDERWQDFVLSASRVDVQELLASLYDVKGDAKQPAVGQLDVWLGFLKLDDKLPTVPCLERLLYESERGSAEGADVIALFLVDLFVHPSSVVDLRSLLRKAMGSGRAESYVFNEDDPALLLRQIPAQLVKATDDGLRHVSMHVAVKRQYVRDFDADSAISHSDCFPETLALTCKSARKNEFEPCFKSVLKQEVLLHVNGCDVDLVLLGANLDTHDDAKLGQVEALERMLQVSQRGSAKFCALMWGDFNNRLVASDDLKAGVKETKKGFEILDVGAEYLVDCILDGSRRSELLQKDALTYCGLDLTGRPFRAPRCNRRLLELFETGIEAAKEADALELPLPSYKYMPLETILSQSLQHQIRLLEVVCLDSLQPVDWSQFLSAEMTYFSDSARYVHRDSNGNLLLPLGWPDGVGVWKANTVAASIQQWQSEWNLRSFDHLPMRSLLSLKLGSERTERERKELKVWLGFVKLYGKKPTLEALTELLYRDDTCSAVDCDVIALHLASAFVTPECISDFQSVLKKCMALRDALNTKDYVFNEDDPALPSSQIPAEVVNRTEDGMTFVSMHVAVKRKHIRKVDGSDFIKYHDCFPGPTSVVGKSGFENERSEYRVNATSTDHPRLVLRQDVLLWVDGREVDVVLLGADLDTNVAARLVQVNALERLLRMASRDRTNFCALCWGDFANPLVAFEGMKDHVVFKEGKFAIPDSGVRFLLNCLREPSERLALLHKDSLTYSGADVTGKPHQAPPCNIKLRQMFSLSLDAALASGVVPWPFYQVQPFEVTLAQQLGCRLKLVEMASLSRIRALSPLTWPHSSSTLEREGLLSAYFNWTEDGKKMQRKIRVEHVENDRKDNYYLQFGWLDGVAWYKKNSVKTTLCCWETVQSVQAFDHLPMRAKMQVML
ncbi:Reverse transcriptase domain-containing protein [Durusdinium trenchii]|uniref:Reverse transcriptase domain-containing protein n=1 Tax=Durusdinium trenchii TaxID=1381693 RepID=A0ABP0KS30_9DINO